MRHIPDFVLRGVVDELEVAREWLRAIHAPEKKAIHDQTPIAVTYWIDRAERVIREVADALDRLDVEDDEDRMPPEAFRFRAEADEPPGDTTSAMQPHRHDRVASADAPDEWSCVTCPADWRTEAEPGKAVTS